MNVPMAVPQLAAPGLGLPAAGLSAPAMLEDAHAQRILTEAARQLLRLGRADLAKTLAEKALAENDHCADTLSVLASVLDQFGDWQGSLAHLRRAYAVTAEAPQVRLNLAIALLRLGDYREGLPLYEARIDKPTWAGFATVDSRTAARDRLLRPGEGVEGRRILVLAEQGLGDCIMFARYVAMLAREGACITLACNPTLRSFFERIPGIETLLSPPSDQPYARINLAAAQFDAWTPLLSLALWFGVDAPSIPAKIPYWQPDQTRVAQWRARFANAGRRGARKVGLVFQANPAGASYAQKSMTIGEVLPLLALEGIDFVNLQHGPAGRELGIAAHELIDPLTTEAPLEEYGAAIAATDLLISVDTMAAHLAGAMGHPVCITVPQSPHWAWGLGQPATPWYSTARIFRQRRPRNWADTVAELAAYLNASAATSLDVPIVVTSRPQRIPAKTDSPSQSSRGNIKDERAAGGLARVARAMIACERPDLARPIADLALQVDGACCDAHDAMGDILERAGDWDAAFQRRRKAATRGAQEFRFKLGVAQLRHGKLKEGFANYEARVDLPLWRKQALPLEEGLAAVQDQRLRPGDPVAGRRIVVFTEQGLGDTFFGARFLSLLADRGAEIVLVCREPLRPFFARLPFLETILSPPEDRRHAKIDLRRLDFDAFCPLLSLPHALGVAKASDLPKPPYLAADPAQIAAWRSRFMREGRPGRPKIGLVWRAHPSHDTFCDRSKHAQDLQDLTALGGLDIVDLINLQHGPAGRELSSILPGMIDAPDEPSSLDSFAARVAATDLLITVDPMAAHCAGAMGHPVWVAFSSLPAWYWGLRREECGWYPSARLFRRSLQSGWETTVQAVVAELRRKCPVD